MNLLALDCGSYSQTACILMLNLIIPMPQSWIFSKLLHLFDSFEKLQNAWPGTEVQGGWATKAAGRRSDRGVPGFQCMSSEKLIMERHNDQAIYKEAILAHNLCGSRAGKWNHSFWSHQPRWSGRAAECQLFWFLWQWQALNKQSLGVLTWCLCFSHTLYSHLASFILFVHSI